MRADLQQFLQGAVHGSIAFLHIGSAAAQSINAVCGTVQGIAHLVHAFADFLSIRRLCGSSLGNLIHSCIYRRNGLSDAVKIAGECSRKLIHIQHGIMNILNNTGESGHYGVYGPCALTYFITAV